jgi:hypothetical protein
LDRHADDVFATGAGERGEVLRADHAGVTDEDAAAQLPPLEVLLHTGHGHHVHRVAGEDPVAQREAVARHRQADHDLRYIEAAVLRMPALAWRSIDLATGCRAATHFVTRSDTTIGFVDLEVQRRGVIEHQLHIEVQKISHTEVDRLLDRLLVGLEEIHRSIEVLQAELPSAFDPNVLAQPLLVT